MRMEAGRELDARVAVEVLKGIEEAARNEGRYLNDDELEVMPDVPSDRVHLQPVSDHSTDVNGAPSEPPPDVDK